MKLNARIPVIPLPYKDKELAVEKELMIEYGQDTEFPTLWIVDEFDKTIHYNITQGIIDAMHGSPGDNFTIEIENVGTVKLGDILNLLYTISLTHDEAWSVETLKKMIPTTIVDNQGIVYAPRTLSTAVYTEAGETLDARLKSISKIGMSVVRTDEFTRTMGIKDEPESYITIPYPFANYEEQGNSFMLYVGTVLVELDRYTVENGKLYFNDPDDYIDSGRSCTFVFIYNSLTPETGVLLVMDGKYITPHTIETNRLAEVSDSIDLNTNDAVASARAVCTLRNVLNERIDGLAGNVSVTCLADSSSTSTELVVKIPNYKLKDSNMIHIRLREDLAPNATLQVNDEVALPIYDGNNRVSAGPVAGEIINVSYSSLENKFYIYGVSTFKFETTYYHNSPDPGTTTIPFNLSYDVLVDKVNIFYNGVRMFPDINYTMNESSIELLDFESEAGDLFTFELIQIVPVKK